MTAATITGAQRLLAPSVGPALPAGPQGATKALRPKTVIDQRRDATARRGRDQRVREAFILDYVRSMRSAGCRRDAT